MVSLNCTRLPQGIDLSQDFSNSDGFNLPPELKGSEKWANRIRDGEFKYRKLPAVIVFNLYNCLMNLLGRQRELLEIV